MDTFNLPRADVVNCKIPITADDWLISITNRDHEDAKVTAPFGKILFMKFDDVGDDQPGRIKGCEARQMAEFIAEAMAGNKNIAVNCHAGVCRSGAVVEVLRLLGYTIREDVESPERRPNMMVFNLLRQCFPDLRQSWE